MKIKKVLSTILTLAMTFAFIPAMPTAATPELTEVSSNAILTVGSVYCVIEDPVWDQPIEEKNVNVSVSISASSGLASGSYILHYDTTIFDIVTATSGSVLDTLSPSVNLNDADGTVSIDFSGNHDTNLGGNVLDLTFRIKTFTTGAKPLTLEVLEMKNDNSDDIIYTITQGVIYVCLLGDVTGDGRVSPSDALKILQYIAGRVSLTELQKRAADYTNDGIIKPSDALKLLQYTTGKYAY